MIDRVPKYPGRVKMTPVAGQANTYDMTRADEPTQVGTPLNKGTLLSDATAAALGLPNTAVPDEGFAKLSKFNSELANEYLWERSYQGKISYVNSSLPDTYPPTPPDKYTYTPLGQLGNLHKIVSGTYTGTGASSLGVTFPFIPKILIINGKIGSGSDYERHPANITFSYGQSAAYSAAGYLQIGRIESIWGWGSKSIMWSGTYYDIFNNHNEKYNYVAIG